jgi:hypothetical protein
VDLYPGSVVSEQAHGHAPFFQDQDGVVAVSGERDLRGVLVHLADVPGHHQQVPWGLAHVDPPGAFPSVKKACPELTAQPQVALELAKPARQAAGIGERRPQVIDVGVVAVLHTHDTLAVRHAQGAHDAVARGRVAVHVVLLRSRLPRAASVYRASRTRVSRSARPGRR